ncbi:ATP phosphoribosyltransferase regulatory subunit [Pararhodobacter oceanensis]|uniref:Histidine--tRNA ligase n=1 Tax=Pararhodobacter oceanensis TaxID=2172121 RepID=A0A2T8HX83_9RHOB|nr:ATP phosphoribosyltransferase regulatory subunit [Pararhodobacter oceanensis]PVH30024.1 ATP phosphoribosyltransferase regulatory subunit [Pararhodobacter oceanensis]
MSAQNNGGQPGNGQAARAEAQRLFGAFQNWGAVPIEAAILQPAGTLLDLYGEDIRARAYVTHDPVQGEMMLRPDFTVPVVQTHMAGGAEPARYCYMGEVFRKQEGAGGARASEYLQVGYEVFDRANPQRADAEVFALFARLLSGRALRPSIGDIGILRAAVNGLPTSDLRRAALMRHLWRPQRFRALLERFAGRAPLPEARAALLARLQAGERVESAAPQIGLRSGAEVEARLTKLLSDAQTPHIPGALVDRVEALLNVADKAPKALAQMRAHAGDMPWIAPSLDLLEQRLAALAALGIDVDALDFEASYGRTTLEYYDGFVFGFSADGREDLPPVASGGRFDALTTVLGQGSSIPAVGGVVRPALLVELEGGA